MPQYEIDIEVNADDNASRNLDRANKSVGGLGKTLGGVGGIAGGVAAAGVGALGAAMVGVGVQAFNLAGEVETASAKMEGTLGLAEGEAAQYEETMRSIFKNNFGESFEDIADAVILTGQTLADLPFDITDQEMQRIVESAFTLQDAFGADMQSSVSAAELLMTNFALTSEEAFDLLAGGFQRGLDTSGDFLDTINEYGGLFSEGGASAEEFFSIIETGAQAGVLGTDKVADAFKEFQIRLLEGSSAVDDAFDSLGLFLPQILEDLNAGSITTVEVMTMVLEALSDVEDQTERNRIGTELFGTQWEDSGASMMLSINAGETALEDLQGTLEETGEIYDTSAQQWETASRLWQEALIDVGKEFRSLGVEVIPWIIDLMETSLIPMVKNFTEIIGDIGGGLSEMFPDDPGGGGGQQQGFDLARDSAGFGGATGAHGPLDFFTPGLNRQGEAAGAVNVTVQMQSGNAADAREGARTGVEEALWQSGGPY